MTEARSGKRKIIIVPPDMKSIRRCLDRVGADGGGNGRSSPISLPRWTEGFSIGRCGKEPGGACPEGLKGREGSSVPWKAGLDESLELALKAVQALGTVPVDPDRPETPPIHLPGNPPLGPLGISRRRLR